jgi:hypothetical protein
MATSILVEPLPHQQNTYFSSPDLSLGTKESRKERGQATGGDQNHHFVFGEKGGILLMFQRLNENHWWPLTAFLLKILDNVSSSGSGSGIAASSHWGQYVEGDQSFKLYGCFKIYFNNSGNFWVPHRIYVHVKKINT